MATKINLGSVNKGPSKNEDEIALRYSMTYLYVVTLSIPFRLHVSVVPHGLGTGSIPLPSTVPSILPTHSPWTFSSTGPDWSGQIGPYILLVVTVGIPGTLVSYVLSIVLKQPRKDGGDPVSSQFRVAHG